MLCLPFAGAGPSFFHTWKDHCDELGLEVVPVKLPGRERWIDETPYTDVHVAVDGIFPDVVESLDPAVPVVVFGHSLGAVLAYELTRRLTEHGTRVDGLFVSGSPGPWSGRKPASEGLGDEEFLARVEELAGYRHQAFDVPDLRDLLLPTLRADVRMHEDYVPGHSERLPVPVTAFRGMADELVSLEQTEGWRAATGAEFELVELPGSHMYLADTPRVLLEMISTRARRGAPGAG
ncbi:thioesterase II family protein [Sphaerisporangium corydalis]|uniref:Thioesterase II family protein n=1 Tax=Sphaerisporangium corydalis TaxID=1441875 RepID=A0ABV9ETI0_9ACTN|nr:alpha/beta fold hydrolase [Sphaerisporangium corydalis]